VAEHEQMTPDNTETRAATVAGLAVEEVAKAKDLRRFKRETRFSYVLSMGMAVFVVFLYGQVQHERARNTLEACKVSNREHAAIGTFVRGTIPAKRMRTPSVREYFARVEAGKPIPAALVKRSQVVMFLSRTASTFPQRNCEEELGDKVKGFWPW
jgi:hypothetical protein